MVCASPAFLTYLSSVPWHLITWAHFSWRCLSPRISLVFHSVSSLSLAHPLSIPCPYQTLTRCSVTPSGFSLMSQWVEKHVMPGQRPTVGTGQPHWARALLCVLIQASISAVLLHLIVSFGWRWYYTPSHLISVHMLTLSCIKLLWLLRRGEVGWLTSCTHFLADTFFQVEEVK